MPSSATDAPTDPANFGLSIGESVTFSKTIGESDVLQFAGITGDFARQHIDEHYMQRTQFGGRIAHGVLTLGLASTTSTALSARTGRQTVSYGYDRIRFTAPVRIGDTVEITYTVDSVDVTARRIRSEVRGVLQDGTLCLVATHILAVVDDPGEQMTQANSREHS
jgi:acyl dehydratase